MATCKTCGGPGAPQKGGPCVKCLARQSPKALFKSGTKEQERGERRGRQQAVQVARSAAQGDLNRLDKLGSQADEILRRDSERMQRELEMADVIKRNTELLEQIQRDLVKPSDDPEYIKKLQTTQAARDAAANKITQIDLVPDGEKTYVGVGAFRHGEARELGLLLSSHFEAKIRQHE